MMPNEVLHPAEERLLDAALVQLFAESRPALAPRRDIRGLLVAALVLLGIGVVAATAWLARSPQRDELQEPATVPMPAEVPGEERSGIEALPTTTENLFAKFTDPRDLLVVERFPDLRRLRLWPEKVTIFGISTGAYRSAWTSPPADLLAPIATLTRLEVLSLPHELRITPALLAPLAGHPSLREIELVRDQFTIDEHFVAALAQIPHVRSLVFHLVPLGPDALHHLAALPLRSLQLQYCSGLDATGWAAVLRMRTLQRLSLHGWNWPTGGAAAAAANWKPTADELGRLRELPRLRELELAHCDIDDEQFAALPETLTTLQVFGTALTPNGLGAVRRLVALRELDIDTQKGGLRTIEALFAADSEPMADAFADAVSALKLQKLHYRGALTEAVTAALGAQTVVHDLEITTKKGGNADFLTRLPLQRLVWRGPLTPEVLQAIAKAPDLRELMLSSRAIPDLAPLADAAKLETLTLSEDRIENGVPAAVLAPLARSKSLRTVSVHVTVIRGEPHPSEAALQRAVGDRIRLRLHQDEQTVKR